jgi:hypothetical protein
VKCDESKQVIIRYATNNTLLAMAETRERRQEKLDHFFREAYSTVCLLLHTVKFVILGGGKIWIKSIGNW